MITVRVQEAPFDAGVEFAALTSGRSDVGGVATFVGHVRGGEVTALRLEHYPAVTALPLRPDPRAIVTRRWRVAPGS